MESSWVVTLYDVTNMENKWGFTLNEVQNMETLRGLTLYEDQIWNPSEPKFIFRNKHGNQVSAYFI